MGIEVDLGAFDLAVKCEKEVEWLEACDDIAVLNLRKQFEDNLNLICANFQKVLVLGLTKAIKQKGMYFELPDLNMKEMTDDSIADLTDLG